MLDIGKPSQKGIVSIKRSSSMCTLFQKSIRKFVASIILLMGGIEAFIHLLLNDLINIQKRKKGNDVICEKD